MGSPTVIGMHFKNEEKLAYCHSGGLLEEEGIFGELARCIQKYSDDQLQSAFEIVQVINEEHFDENTRFDEVFGNNGELKGQLSRVVRDGREEEFELTEVQKIIIDVFRGASYKPLPLENGFVQVAEHPKDYNIYYIDLDQRILMAQMDNGFTFGIPFWHLRELNGKDLAFHFTTLSDAWSKLSGYDLTSDSVEDSYTTGKVTQKGQVTIPVEIRSILQVEEGDRLVFDKLLNDEIRLRKLVELPLENWMGSLGGESNDDDRNF